MPIVMEKRAWASGLLTAMTVVTLMTIEYRGLLERECA